MGALIQEEDILLTSRLRFASHAQEMKLLIIISG